jgi:hypothetical protein
LTSNSLPSLSSSFSTVRPFLDLELDVTDTIQLGSEMFEGLGLGSRLAILPLPSRYKWVPYAGGILYSAITPLGIAAGLGVRTSYDPDSATASIVSGVLDAISAGVLLYTGMIELLAHDCAGAPPPSVDYTEVGSARSHFQSRNCG